jgi:hypothetical protein
MPYTTLPENADLMQGKTNAFAIIPVSDDIDLGLFWQKAGGNANGKLKVTLVKLDGTTTVVKLAEDGKVLLVNTSPPKLKVLIETTDTTGTLGATGTGKVKLYSEFKIDDSWIQDDVVLLNVNDDPISG